MAALDVATALANVRTMLSGLSAWQTICGVSSSTEAAYRIFYGAIDENQEINSAPCIILDVSSVPTNWLGARLHGTLAVEVRCYLITPESERVTIGSQYVWVWQKLSAMMDGINGAVGDAGEIMMNSLSVPLMPGRVDPDSNQGENEWLFIIELTADFI